MSAPAQADATLTVNEALVRWPNAIAVLNVLGVDTCCGGGATLDAAAEQAGVRLETLLTAITETTTEAFDAAMARTTHPPAGGSCRCCGS